MSRSNPITPLRYPGGKSVFAPYLKSLIEVNDLYGCEYLEPFAGGVGAGLDLLFSGYCSRLHINDIDLAIYNFWVSIIKDSEAFLSLLENTSVTIEEWFAQKNVLENPKNYTSLQHGFAAFFLNRTNRSGILKAGAIGGKNQDGNYKLDSRFNKEKLAIRIKRISDYADQIQIHNKDALDLLKQLDQILPERSLIYLDPPYYVKGQGLYRNFYNHEDHVSIQKQLVNVKQNWLVSYDNCPEIREIYGTYRQNDYMLNYCAYHKKKGYEVIIFDRDLVIPKESLIVD